MDFTLRASPKIPVSALLQCRGITHTASSLRLDLGILGEALLRAVEALAFGATPPDDIENHYHFN